MSDALDLPGTFNSRIAGRTQEGKPWLVRSAHLDDLRPEGLRVLLDLGVETVVDLREPGERRARRLPGIQVHHVPLYRLPGGPPQTGSLTEVYSFLLQKRGGPLAEAVQAVAEAEGPALLHCAVGKDRTGLVTALLRRAAGDELPAVLSDYELSASQLPAHHHDNVLAVLGRKPLDARSRRSALALHTSSPGETLATALGGVESRWGDTAGYLRHHGLPERVLRALDSRTLGRRRTAEEAGAVWS